MKISIIGAGNIGSTLGKKWAGVPHQLWFGVREPADSKFDDLRSYGQVSAVAEAIAAAEVILLSLPGAAVAEFASIHGPALTGKILIDATNNSRSPVINNLGILKEKAARAHLTRAFSTLGWENFAEPQLGGVTIDLFYCGDAASRVVTDQLIAEIGLRPIYLGDMEMVDLVDNMTRLWLILALRQGHGRRMAFKLLEE